jgi:hypothetical protein
VNRLRTSSLPPAEGRTAGPEWPIPPAKPDVSAGFGKNLDAGGEKNRFLTLAGRFDTK